MSPLEPLAKALLGARNSDGTWPEPLAWLAEQVFPRATECEPIPVGEDGNPLPYDSIALRWPTGWATGLTWEWETWMHDHGYIDWGNWLEQQVGPRADFLALLVEAVQAIAKGDKHD